MEWKLRSPACLTALLLLTLVIAASTSCERERQPENPNRERPPRPKLENPLTLSIVPLVDGSVPSLDQSDAFKPTLHPGR